MIFGLIRLLLILGFVYFLFKWLQSHLRKKISDRPDLAENDNQGDAEIEDMSACPKCGVFISKNEEHSCQKKDQ